MANDFGLRVGVDGEAEFKRALKEINSEMRTLGSEAKLVASQFDDNDKSINALTERSKVLTKQLEEQKKKIDLLSDGLANAKQKYGENSTQANEWQRKLNEAQAEANKMQRELDKMTKSINEATEAEKNGTSTTGDYSNSMKEAGKSADEAGGAASGMGASFSAAAAVAVAAVAAIGKALLDIGKAFAEVTTDAAAYADELTTQSKVTGISVEKLQEYNYAAKLVDVSVDTLTNSMRRNIMAMQNAQRGTANYVEAYEKLGVTITREDGTLRDSEEVYWELIEALGNVENLTERDALAMTIMGRSAQDLNPLIIAGTDAMKAYAQEAHEVGYVLDAETISSYNKANDSLDRFNNTMTSAKNAIASIFMPTLDSLAEKGSKWLGEFSKATQDANGDVEKMADALSSILPQAADDMMEDIPQAVELYSKVIATFATEIIKKLPDILNSVLEGLGVDIWDIILDNTGVLGRGINQIRKGFMNSNTGADELLKAEQLRDQITSLQNSDNPWSAVQLSELYAALERQNELLERLGQQPVVVAIGDEEIGRAQARYENAYGARVGWGSAYGG